jgi:ATP-dependent Clp protease ATP-binding subunit ClpA
MFERFTAHARRSVVMAQEEARRMHHNYIGTEHVLLGLLRQPEGLAYGVLEGVGVNLDGTREKVTAMVGTGKSEPKGHIPFTPRAKKILELALREALALHNNYIGTEHILLGLIREGDGVAAQILREHADLLAIRASVLDLVPLGAAEDAGDAFSSSAATVLRRVRERITGGRESAAEHATPATPAARTLPATPAADATLARAARLAGTAPVGSHHLLLAALADPDSAAARVFASLGVLDQAKEALRTADVTGTSDEPPEEAGRRQMVVQVTDEMLTIVATDPLIVTAGKAALQAVNATSAPREEPGSTSATATAIRGDHPAAASFAAVWQSLHASLTKIAETAPRPGTALPDDTAPSTDAALPTDAVPSTSGALPTDTEPPAETAPPADAA